MAILLIGILAGYVVARAWDRLLGGGSAPAVAPGEPTAGPGEGPPAR